MAAIEWRVLSGIIREGGLDTAIQSGLRAEFFKDSEAKRVYGYLRDYWFHRSTYHTLPTFNSLKRKFPSFTMTAKSESDLLEDPMKPLVHELKVASHDTDVRMLATYFQELVDEDPQDAIESFHKHITEIANRYHHSEKMGLSELNEKAIAHYEGIKSGVSYGIPWPWEPLTRDTLGKRAGDFIVIYGRMKTMKTWVALYNAIYDYKENNCRVLVWSKEMNKEKMSLRAASLLAEVDYQYFKRGRLPKHLEKKTFDTLQKLSENKPIGDGSHRADLLFLAGRDAPKTLVELEAAIENFKPDVVYLDSWYHLQVGDEAPKQQQRHNRIAELAEAVKSLAENQMIPIIAVHQANRQGESTYGETMADMSDSDVIAREADLIIRVFKKRGRELFEEDYEVALEVEKKAKAEAEYAALASAPKRPKLPKLGTPKQKNKNSIAKEQMEKAIDNPDDDETRVSAELALVMGGNREGTLEAFTIHAIPGYNFDLIRADYTIGEIEAWIKGDSAGVAPKKKIPEKDFKNAFSKQTLQAGAASNAGPGPKIQMGR